MEQITSTETTSGDAERIATFVAGVSELFAQAKQHSISEEVMKTALHGLTRVASAEAGSNLAAVSKY